MNKSTKIKYVEFMCKEPKLSKSWIKLEKLELTYDLKPSEIKVSIKKSLKKRDIVKILKKECQQRDYFFHKSCFLEHLYLVHLYDTTQSHYFMSCYMTEKQIKNLKRLGIKIEGKLIQTIAIVWDNK